MGDIEADSSAVARELLQAETAVAFTGAGISTASGLPDFRGEDGLWETVDPSAFSMATFETQPAEFWAEWQGLYERLLADAESEPNPAHEALDELVESGTIDAIVTQNADGLHQAAGADSEDVIELHGNATRSRCLECRFTEPTEDTLDRFDGETPPHCPDCGGRMKPDAVLFGEPLPREAMNRARGHIALADVLLVVGTSLSVEPAASLPTAAVETGATVIVNDVSATPVDDLADVRIDRPAESFLPDLAEAVTETESPGDGSAEPDHPSNTSGA